MKLYCCEILVKTLSVNKQMLPFGFSVLIPISSLIKKISSVVNQGCNIFEK